MEKVNRHRNKKNIQERIEISPKPSDEHVKTVHQEHAIILDPLQAESTRSIHGEDAETLNPPQDEDVRGIHTEDTETSNKPQDDNGKSIQAEDTETSNELHDEHGRRISEEHSAVPDESQEMTMTHGFYAGMGSYYIDVDMPGEPSGKPHPKRVYLTAKGVLASVEAGKLSLPPKEVIAERSKSDALAKTLVCLQAGYIIVQCISRLGSGLPLTFLEINTLGHVLCALIMYSFWFHKPQDLTLSVAPESSFAKQLGTWYACCHGTHYADSNFCDLYKVIFDRAKTAGSSKVFGSQRSPPTSIQIAASALRERNVFEGFPQESDVAILGGDDCVLLLQVHGGLEEASIRIRSSDLWNMFTAVYCVSPELTVPDYIHINPRVRWCKIFSFALKKDSTAIARLLDKKAEPLGYRNEHLEEEISNWPSEGLLSGHALLPPLAIAISTALYGGLHAAAWHSFFPTEVEKWFWRVSSTVIAASGLLFAYGMVSYLLWEYIIRTHYWSYYVRWDTRALRWVMELLSLDGSDFEAETWFGRIIYISLGACCVIARVYLVVESFISLRKVPVEVYQTPDWTQWIPHL